MLHRVSTITTASGGTFPGLKYAQDVYQDVPFRQTFQSVYQWLLDTDVFDEALKRVNDPSFWEQYPNKRRSMINGAATLYQESLFQGASLSVFYDRPEDKLPHLTSFIGTSTEFKEGLNFRLAWTRVPHESLTFGTFRWDLHFPQKPPYAQRNKLGLPALAEIQLGDMAAASSAFPGAFEPISFPDDFRPNGSVALQALIDEPRRQQIRDLQKERQALAQGEEKDDAELRELTHQINDLRDICNLPTALMDGGILDNQGLGAAFYAEDRLGNGDAYHSLFFAADNASYFVTDFTFEDLSQPETGPGARRVLKVATAVTAGLALAGLLATFLVTPWLGLPLLGGAGLVAAGLYWVDRKVTKLSRQLLGTQNLRGYWEHMVKLPLPLVLRFLKERGKSIFLMVEQVFLKQIRSFYQGQLYQDRRFEHRRLISHLYLFLRPKSPDFKNSEFYRIIRNDLTRKTLEAGMPLDQIFDTVTEAYSMPLTLWFGEKEKERELPECLIATGQLTACAMLINHMISLGVPLPDGTTSEKEDLPYGSYSPEEQLELRSTLAQALKDWNRFKENPMFLVEELRS